jgi:hypothetical protein
MFLDTNAMRKSKLIQGRFKKYLQPLSENCYTDATKSYSCFDIVSLLLDALVLSRHWTVYPQREECFQLCVKP